MLLNKGGRRRTTNCLPDPRPAGGVDQHHKLTNYLQGKHFCLFVFFPDKCKRFLQEFYTEDDNGKKVFKYGAQLVSIVLRRARVCVVIDWLCCWLKWFLHYDGIGLNKVGKELGGDPWIIINVIVWLLSLYFSQFFVLFCFFVNIS